jgi:hypothetical protein
VGLRIGPDIYQSIGVSPVINCRGPFTVAGVRIELPEVREAVDAAARQYVYLDEMMDKIGARLAELTGAEFGLAGSGCAACVAHITAACVSGGNPELHVQIPNLAGFAKDEVVIPKHSRNHYDQAVRSVVSGSSRLKIARSMRPRSGRRWRWSTRYPDPKPKADRFPTTRFTVSPEEKYSCRCGRSRRDADDPERALEAECNAGGL